MKPYSTEQQRLQEESDRLRIRWLAYCTKHFHRFGKVPADNAVYFKNCRAKQSGFTL